MAHDDGVGGAVVGDPFVPRALLRRLEGGHADGIADHFGDDAIVAAFRQFEGFQSEVIHAIEAEGGGFHGGVFS